MILKRILPNRIATQFALLMFAVIVTFHLLVSATLWLARPSPNFVPPSLQTAMSLVRLLAVLPDQDRAEVISHAPAVDKDLHVSILAPSTPLLTSSTGWEEYLRKKLGPNIEVESADDLFARSGRFSARFSDGKRVGVQLSQGDFGPPAHLPGVLLASLAFLAMAIAIFSVWASRALTAP
jgi:hypothetical protein